MLMVCRIISSSSLYREIKRLKITVLEYGREDFEHHKIIYHSNSDFASYSRRYWFKTCFQLVMSKITIFNDLEDRDQDQQKM